MEYISKHEAYTMMKDLEAAYIYPPVKEAYGTAARRIDQMPAADVQPVKHGHWDYSEKENGECAWYFCSECDSPAEQLYDDSPLLSEFCPNCGARMDGDRE